MLISLIMMPLILLIGVYFSHKLRCVHLSSLYNSLLLLTKPTKSTDNKNISSFLALSTILGGNLGTGNISGVAVAITTGGPGSLLWMSVIILVTSIIKYVSCFLGIKYRVKNKNGYYCGGPMYYLKNGASSPILAILFALSLIFSAITVGNLVQVNSLTLPILEHSFIHPFFYGCAIAVIVLLVTLGGLQWFTSVITKLVPLMATLYLLACAYILITHHNDLVSAISLIFDSAFTIPTVSGGVMGYGVLHFLSGVKVGFSRGIFATDIGLGLEAIVHSSVQNQSNDDKFAMEQSIISVLSPFIVMLVCIITGLVLIVTGVWNNPNLESTNMCFAAFNAGIPDAKVSGYIMLVILFCFAFTTILTWMFCGNKAIEYIFPNNKHAMLAWKVFFILLLPIGSITQVGQLWKMADVAISLMLILNIYGVVKLFKEIPTHKL